MSEINLDTNKSLKEIFQTIPIIYSRLYTNADGAPAENNTIIEIDFESLSPYVYSKIYIKEYLVEANTPVTLTYVNTGREVPILLEIEASADGDFRIVNNSKNKTHPLSVSNMKANDIVTIDSDTMDIAGIDRDRIVGSIKDVLTLKNGVNI